MICNTCGRYSHSEEANFCEYCGSSFKEHANIAYNTMPQNQGPTLGRMAGQMIAGQEDTEKPIKFSGWFSTYGLLFGSFLIPYVGWLISIALLFFWSFKANTPVSKKNWARVSLVFVAILFVFLVIWIISFFNSTMFQDFLNNGSFDFNSYFNKLNSSLN